MMLGGTSLVGDAGAATGTNWSGSASSDGRRNLRFDLRDLEVFFSYSSVQVLRV